MFVEIERCLYYNILACKSFGLLLYNDDGFLAIVRAFSEQFVGPIHDMRSYNILVSNRHLSFKHILNILNHIVKHAAANSWTFIVACASPASTSSRLACSARRILGRDHHEIQESVTDVRTSYLLVIIECW